MRKTLLLTALMLPGAWITSQAYEMEDFVGSFIATEVVNADNPVAISNLDIDQWVGKKMKVSTNNSDPATPYELKFENMLPLTGYYTQSFYGDVDLATAEVTFLTARVYGTSVYPINYQGYTPYTYDAEGNLTNLYGYFNEELTSFTVDNFVLASIDSDGVATIALTAERVTWEASQTPADPSVSAYFDIEAGGINVAVTAPETLNYESNYAELTQNLTKVVLERSTDWGSTYEYLTEWENVAPGAVNSYLDSDVAFDNSYVQYRATAYLGLATSNATSGCNAGKAAPEVKDVKAVCNADNTVTVSFTLPSEEELLAPLTSVYIMRRNYTDWSTETIATITEDLEADAELSYTDSDVVEGTVYYYTVYTTWQYGSSYGSGAQILVGKDVPGYVENFSGTAAGCIITLTWEPSSVGRNGGEYDLEATRYKITRQLSNDTWDYDLGGYASLVTITPEEGIAETTFVDEIEADGPTEFYYQIYDFLEGGEPVYAGSCYVVAGPAYSLPYAEAFADYVESYWGGSYYAEKMWTETSNGSAYGYVTTNSYFGDDWTNLVCEDGGAFYNVTYYDYFGANCTLNYTSSAIDFSTATNPVAIFDYAVINVENPCTLSFQAGLASTSMEALTFYETVAIYDENVESYEWRRAVVSLADLAGESEVKVSFQTNSNEWGDYTRIPVTFDNLLIDDFPAVSDLTAVVNDGWATLAWSDPSTDTQDAISYDIYRDGELIASNVMDFCYDDELGDAKEYTYYVVALYETANIKTPASNVVTVTTTGLNNLSAADARLNINGRNISVVGAQSVNIYSADGRLVYSSREGVARYNAAAGVYIISIDGAAQKVVVK